MSTLDEKIIVPSAKGRSANTGVPTQVANPSRASWRTWIQAVLAFGVAVNGVALGLLAFISANPEVANYLPANVLGWVTLVANGIVVGAGFLAKLFALIMAQPGVNEFISNTPWLSWLAPIKPQA